jgi:hypothetical protein
MMAATSEPRRTRAQESIVLTIKLCATSTKRPTTLRVAIDRSIAELTRTGRIRGDVVLSTPTPKPA